MKLGGCADVKTCVTVERVGWSGRVHPKVQGTIDLSSPACTVYYPQTSLSGLCSTSPATWPPSGQYQSHSNHRQLVRLVQAIPQPHFKAGNWWVVVSLRAKLTQDLTQAASCATSIGANGSSVNRLNGNIWPHHPFCDNTW